MGTLEDAVLHNTSQFHKWHSELEAACASETEEKYKRYADLLSSHVASCESILAKVLQAARCGGGINPLPKNLPGSPRTTVLPPSFPDRSHCPCFFR